ncbi:ribosome small subunit-dependent GTPase A [Paenibacillus sp. P96]|uniref:Small ribosomal subunit biogenesis GTPase RsgA n=1 Tax=Paenibacillus zeirhizosphaerae TaxID=2987519 RepID=A0ABT9FRY4_9BACL|nr:ribosome small subunit-dependent GTPase A [Paenibacillus sp. P96]MDP4097434.1 ribosome small subunit-dependent GTPase A [Paenibacillus sp. P96]
MSIEKYGWSEQWLQLWEQLAIAGYNDSAIKPARVTADFGQKMKIMTNDGERWAVPSGKLRHETLGAAEQPAVGDWVAVAYSASEDDAVIHAVLPRKSRISRQAAGVETREQIIAANVDTLFLVQALNGDFNVRRMERYLIMAWNSGVDPVIVLSKSDLCPDPSVYVAQMEMTAPGVPVLLVSAWDDAGKEQLESYLRKGRTVALTGSSGCGKSTLVNWLSGEELQDTQGIREADSRGRHTTTHRQLFPLLHDAVLIDTPGMRELSLWSDESGTETTFADIESLAARCRFTDCRHMREEGCAVKEAVSSGALSAPRLDSYRKMKRELEYQSRKENEKARKVKAGKASRSLDSTGWRHDMEW